MIRFYFFILILASAINISFAKSDPPEYGMLFGCNFMPIKGNTYLEIGYIPYTFYQENTGASHTGFGSMTIGYAAPNLGFETKISSGDFILGAKAGITYNRFNLASGVHAIYYTDCKIMIFDYDRKSGLIY